MADEPADKVRDIREGRAPKIDWDQSNMKSSYANVCNATGTREEIVLYFGISHPGEGDEPGVKVQLSDRVILSPFAAKRLAQLLNNVVETYESRFGSLGSAAGERPTGAPITAN